MGDPDINSVVSYLADLLRPVPMDGGRMNRIHASNLLKWAEREYPSHNKVVTVKRLIQIALSDEFHKRNCTAMGYIWAHKGKLILRGLEQKKKEGPKQGGGYRIVYDK